MKFALWLQVNEGRTRRYYCNEINGNIHAPIQLHLLHMCQRICSVTPDRNAKTALKFSKKVFLRIVLTMRDFVGWLFAGVHICRGKCYTYTYMYTHIHTLISLFACLTYTSVTVASNAKLLQNAQTVRNNCKHCWFNVEKILKVCVSALQVGWVSGHTYVYYE